MIVHKDAVYPGEHEAIVDDELWNAVQHKLKVRAPPRSSTRNEGQNAMLAGLLTDPEGRQMVPTFTCKGPRRYRYYETRRDLARKGDPKATRFAMRALDRHAIEKLLELLSDEHGLRRLGRITDAALLAKVLRTAKSLVACLNRERTSPDAFRAIAKSISVTQDQLLLSINPVSLGFGPEKEVIVHAIGWPKRKPFREQKLRLDAPGEADRAPDHALVQLLRDARATQELALANPDLPLHLLARREGRCRKQMTKLLRLSWLSPRIVESIIDGQQPKHITRKRLLETNLPICWNQQERLLGFLPR